MSVYRYDRIGSGGRFSRRPPSGAIYLYAVGILLILALAAAFFVWCSPGSQPEAKPSTTPTSRPVTVIVATARPSSPTTFPTAAPAAPATVTPVPATPTPAPKVYVKVANTGGTGANLRGQPSSAANKLDSLPDGTVLEVIGPDVRAEDRAWKNVKDKSGKTGFVAAEFTVAAPQ